MEDEKMVEVETEEITTPEDYEVISEDEVEETDVRLLALGIGVAGGLAALGAAKFVGWVAPKARSARTWFRNKTRKKGQPIETTGKVVEETEENEDSEEK